MSISWEVEILDWSKYNPKDSVNNSWYRQEASMISDGRYSSLSPQAKILLIYLFCQRTLQGASGELRGSNVVYPGDNRGVSKAIHCRPENVFSVFEELEKYKWLKIHNAPSSRARLNERTNERTKAPSQHALDAVAYATNPPPTNSKKQEIVKEIKLHRLAETWNAHCESLPKVKGMNKRRTKRCEERWKEQTYEDWVNTIGRMAKSSFCQGKNDRGWKADFDFLLQPETWIKVNEGKYDDRGQQEQKSRPAGSICGVKQA